MQISTISRGMTVVGKIVGEGTVHVLGQVEGELRALTVLIDEGAKVEGDVVGEELTIGGTVKSKSRSWVRYLQCGSLSLTMGVLMSSCSIFLSGNEARR